MGAAESSEDEDDIIVVDPPRTIPVKQKETRPPRFEQLTVADLAARYRLRHADLSPYGLPVLVRGLGDCLEVARIEEDDASVVRLVYPLCDRPFDVHGFYLVPSRYMTKLESTIVRLRLGGDADVNWVVMRGNPHEHVVEREHAIDRRNLQRLRKRWSADYARVSERWE